MTKCHLPHVHYSLKQSLLPPIPRQESIRQSVITSISEQHDSIVVLCLRSLMKLILIWFQLRFL